MIDPADKACGETRILVADDEQAILDEYASVLAGPAEPDERKCKLAVLEAELFGNAPAAAAQQAGFSLCLCRQADEAVNAVEQSIRDGRPFAIAFLDVRMPPGPNGVDAAERIRKLDEDVNIVFVTGFSDISPEEIRIRVPPVDKLLYCQKPFHASELRQVAYALSEKWRAHRRLQSTRQTLEQVVTSTSVIVYSCAPERDRSPAFISENVLPHFGWRPASFRHDPGFWIDKVHDDDLPRVHQALKDIHDLQEVSVDYRFRNSSGEYRWVSDRMRILRNGAGAASELVGCWFDITERREAEARIHSLAYFDAVTGLPNRLLMEELLRQSLSAADRHRHRLAVLFVDVDNFKRINDTLGHETGDALLREVAKRLLSCIRRSDSLLRQGVFENLMAETQEQSVSRLGGDEFVIILSKIADAADATSVAGRISEAFTKPFKFGEEETGITATIGISVYPEDGTDATSLLKNADMAMYYGKAQGRNCHQFFSETMRVRAARRFFIETKLKQALDRGEFILFYQPRLHIDTLELAGMEALVRWQHPNEGLVMPGEFIPVAEENGMILPIGEWVLKEACRQTAAWQAAGLPPLVVSVNLSAVQFRYRRLAEQLTQVLTETGLHPSFLELELTEGVLMEDTKLSASLLAQISELGISISVDDFGTGYSSLAYLKRFPLNILKIDQSFVSDLTKDASGDVIVSATIALGHQLGLRVVAEGVENHSQLDLLRSLGCDEAQGYLFSKPIDAASFEQWAKLRAQVPLLCRAIPSRGLLTAR